MRRLMTLIALAASLLLVATAVPAAAAKGGHKPGPDPTGDYYQVAFELTGAYGLGTCPEPEEPQSLRMAVMGDRTSNHLQAAAMADDDGTTMPRLFLRADVPWSRTYPEPASGDVFDGCHGGPLSGSQSHIPSYFIVHGDRDGNVASVLWAFDVYIEEGTKGKGRTPDIKEYFRLWSSDGATFVNEAGGPCALLPSTSAACLVSGAFQVWHYYPIEQIGEPDFQFTMTITPTG